MEDRQLSRDFWLHEFPCWRLARPEDVARLEETAARVLQPLRNEFGRLKVTSWMWWTSGCRARSGAHSGGGTIDLVALDAPTRDVWRWGSTHLAPAGYIGRWIYEPARASTGQGEHIHMAPRSDMIRVFRDSRIQVLEEDPDVEGRYVLNYDWTGDDANGAPPGTGGGPIEIPGVVVTAGQPGLFGFLAASALIMGLARRGPAHTP